MSLLAFLDPTSGVDGKADERKLADGLNIVSNILKIKLGGADSTSHHKRMLDETLDKNDVCLEIEGLWEYVSYMRPDIYCECLDTLKSLFRFASNQNIIHFTLNEIISGYIRSRQEGKMVYYEQDTGYVHLPPFEKYGFVDEIDSEKSGKEYENNIIRKIMVLVINIIISKKQEASKEIVISDPEEYYRLTGSMYVNKGESNKMYVRDESKTLDLSEELSILKSLIGIIHEKLKVTPDLFDGEIVAEVVKFIYAHEFMVRKVDDDGFVSPSSSEDDIDYFSLTQHLIIYTIKTGLHEEVVDVMEQRRKIDMDDSSTTATSSSGLSWGMSSTPSSLATKELITFDKGVKYIMNFSSSVGVKSYILSNRLRCPFNEDWMLEILESTCNILDRLWCNVKKVDMEAISEKGYWNMTYINQLLIHNGVEGKYISEENYQPIFDSKLERIEYLKMVLKCAKDRYLSFIRKNKSNISSRVYLSDISDIIIRTCRWMRFNIPEGTTDLISKIQKVEDSVSTFVLLVGSKRFLQLEESSEKVDVDEDSQTSYIDDILFNEEEEETSVSVDTLYENSENVHLIMKSVDDFISKHIENFRGIQTADHWDIVREVSEYIRSKGDSELIQKCDAAIDRVLVDRSMYGNGVGLTELFDMVWTQISRFETLEGAEDVVVEIQTSTEPSPSREDAITIATNTLKDRFVEELKEMSGSCGSGHASRLINVFTGFTSEPTVCFDWVDDISNIFHLHFMKRVESEPADIQDVILLSSIDDDVKEANTQLYESWMASTSQEIHDCIKGEYVDNGYITSEEFEEMFEKVKGKYCL